MEWIDGQLGALAGDDFPEAALALVTLGLVAVTGWALLVTALASSPALRGLALALTPRMLRGLLVAGFAGALSVPAAQAHERGDLDGLPLPDRPTVAADLTEPQSQRDATAVVVRRGDTLWAIAQQRLGPHADASAIARSVRRWYAANRDVIGENPDLIRPGQRLTAPSKDRS